MVASNHAEQPAERSIQSTDTSTQNKYVVEDQQGQFLVSDAAERSWLYTCPPDSTQQAAEGPNLAQQGVYSMPYFADELNQDTQPSAPVDFRSDSAYARELQQQFDEADAAEQCEPQLVEECATDNVLRERIGYLPAIRDVGLTSLKSLVNPPESIDKEAARKRLQDLVELYNVTEHVVKGDGNCQFRALSDQLYRSPNYHEQVRDAAVEQLRKHPDVYGDFIEGDYNAYVTKMAADGTWGDHVTLQAVADFFGVLLNLLTSYSEAAYIKVEPMKKKSRRELWLSFWAEIHYNSLYPVEEQEMLQRRLHAVGKIVAFPFQAVGRALRHNNDIMT